MLFPVDRALQEVLVGIASAVGLMPAQALRQGFSAFQPRRKHPGHKFQRSGNADIRIFRWTAVLYAASQHGAKHLSIEISGM